MDHKTYCTMADAWNATVNQRPNDAREFCELNQQEQEAFRDGFRTAEALQSHEKERLKGLVEKAMWSSSYPAEIRAELRKVMGIEPLRICRKVSVEGTSIWFVPAKGFFASSDSSKAFNTLIDLLWANKLNPNAMEYEKLCGLMAKPFE
jgi:hypothetical protein